MKFGLEAEKFLFNLKDRRPSENVFTFLDALSDFKHCEYHTGEGHKTTNEFVLNMVEINTAPSVSPLEVLKDYFYNFLMLKQVAAREAVALVPLASLPLEYIPHMTPKWSYYVQNSILAGEKQMEWTMNRNSPLNAAGNCAGVHVHVAVETPPEFLFSNHELRNKFNMGLMLTPLIAFSSSPYFFNRHQARSMRALNYYKGVYRHFPLNGGLPSIMESSAKVLEYVKSGLEYWLDRGHSVGFTREEVEAQTGLKGANWGPLRWNKHWNTIELRCMESDSLEMDGAKFIWICSAMRRMDLSGENLQCRTIRSSAPLDQQMLEDCLLESGSEISILPSHALADLFERAILFGTTDELVEIYLHRLSSFVRKGIQPGEEWFYNILLRALNHHQSTSELILGKTKFKGRLSEHEGIRLTLESIEEQEQTIAKLQSKVPEIFQLLRESSISGPPEGLHV